MKSAKQPLPPPAEQKEDTNSKRVNKENLNKLWSVFYYTLPYKLLFAISLVFLILSTATTLVFPLIASMLADAAITDDPPFSINELGLFLLVILVLQGVFSYGRILYSAKLSEYTMADIRKDVYKKLISLSIPFFEQRRVGELTSRITTDVTQLQSALSIHLPEFFRQIATLVVGIGIIAYTSIELTLLMLSTLPIGILVAMFFGKYIRRLSRQTQDALAETNVVVEETLQSIQVVKAFTNEFLESLRYNRGIGQVVDLAIKTAQYRGIFVSFLISAVFGGIVLVLWYGAKLVAADAMTVGDLLQFIIYTFFIGGAIGGMGDLYGNLQKAVGASERLLDILDMPAEVEVQEQIDRTRIQGDIIYDQVHFNYPTRPDLVVLQNISLHIGQGQKVALVGASGAGKSTIVQLLLQFYNLDKGNILINQLPIKEYNLAHLRSNIGIVPQEVILFGGSIRENIAYGNPEATDEVVIMAAKKANAWQFIQQFPDGLDTVVGERGIKLSGGQRQRIAIARAILKDPAILILDEATSSLDAESERLVQDALDVLMEGRTTIIIAHRLSTIRKVDCIYVLDGGEIVEQGTHMELSLKEKGLYQNLLKLQFELAD